MSFDTNSQPLQGEDRFRFPLPGCASLCRQPFAQPEVKDLRQVRSKKQKALCSPDWFCQGHRVEQVPMMRVTIALSLTLSVLDADT